MTARPLAAALIAVSAALMPGFLAPSPAHATPPQAVASIKPVHSLVAGVAAGVTEPHLLVGGPSSPHTYSLRPSDARALSQADLVFRIGKEMEIFLQKPLASLAGGARVLDLMEQPGMVLHPLREGGTWEAHSHHPAEAAGHDHEHEHEHEHDHDHGHDHGEGARDAHVWLDVANAKVMVAAIADAFAEADPENAGRYRANAGAMDRRLDEMDAELRARLAPVADRPFVVFHDAYSYLEARYGLTAVGAITVSPEQAPSAGHLSRIREKLRHLEAACIFAEPQFEPAAVSRIVEGTGTRAGVLDPLGADIPDGPELYFTMMRRLAGALVDCLGGASGR
jgi:zinc transport system substrate-binding protein